MRQIPQIGRKLTHKRQERRLISRAVQSIGAAVAQPQIVSPKAELSLNVTPPVAKPKQGDLLALIQRWKDEAARMTPEEIAAEDAAYADFNPPRLSLRIPDMSDHD